ncbi:Rv3235 family protein [Streptomyces sp. NPDC006879]|uniref:Rv3235 family protein n=1 Tax=Streptomyces sp. NPDC006879 TaxID=3364767 RepID=UPI0036BBD4EC
MDRTRPVGRRDQRHPAPSAPTSTPRVPRQIQPHHWFAERLLAVLSGQRPVHWMLGHTIGEAYEQLLQLAPMAPLLTAGKQRPVLRYCDMARPTDHVIEAFARIDAGDRVRAMAFRLEQGPDLRWRCAAVELGGERVPR